MNRILRTGVCTGATVALTLGVAALAERLERRRQLKKRYNEFLGIIREETGYHRATVRALANAEPTADELHEFLSTRPIHRLVNVEELVAEITAGYTPDEIDKVTIEIEGSAELINYLVDRIIQHPWLAVRIVKKTRRMSNVVAQLNITAFYEQPLTHSDKAVLTIIRDVLGKAAIT